MNNRKLLGTGITGTVITAVCCFTPVLVIGLGVAGLSAWLAWLDYVLFPALFMFMGLSLFAFVRLKRGSTSQTNG